VGTNAVATALAFVERGEVDVVLLAGRFTLLDRSAEAELLPLCTERRVSLIAAGVFNSGLLAGGSTFDYESAPPELLVRRRTLEEVCARYDVPLVAAAIQFPLRNPGVASIVVGARSPDEVAEDLQLLDVPVPDDLWSELEQVTAAS
jgi:D-threo-aldose 1-dehydrogenase